LQDFTFEEHCKEEINNLNFFNVSQSSE